MRDAAEQMRNAATDLQRQDPAAAAARAERAAEQLRKGNRVFVEGRFRTREFEGQDGQKRTSLDLTADNVISLERRPRDEEGAFTGAPAAAAAGAGVSGGFSGGGGRPPGDDTDLDDLPF
jgi:single-strand DNA-binding protein